MPPLPQCTASKTYTRAIIFKEQLCGSGSVGFVSQMRNASISYMNLKEPDFLSLLI